MKPTRRITPPGTYFITASTWQKRQLFQSEQLARLFLVTVYHYRRAGHFQLHAFVLMPDHFHLLITPTVPLERTVQLIKGGFSHEVGKTRKHMEIWQRGFTDHRVRDEEDFENHRNYIHANPVERGLVETAKDYRYSSAYPSFRLDLWPSAAKAAHSLSA